MTTPICTPLGVLKKGSWTVEEDVLLRKCIQKYGEGKWHLVPARSGLNRCRKSCRLRWLNYLRPHIKRGDFASDEIDLILRLHKLLGNRWSLIAGRLPGRTANDIKNYWNTSCLLRKSNIATNSPPHHHHRKQQEQQKIKTKNEIITPQPRNFSITNKNVSSCCLNNKSMANNIVDERVCQKPTTSVDDEGVQWWTSLLQNCNNETEELADDKTPAMENGEGNCMLNGQSGTRDDFSLDIDIWNLLNN